MHLEVDIEKLEEEISNIIDTAVGAVYTAFIFDQELDSCLESTNMTNIEKTKQAILTFWYSTYVYMRIVFENGRSLEINKPGELGYTYTWRNGYNIRAVFVKPDLEFLLDFIESEIGWNTKIKSVEVE